MGGPMKKDKTFVFANYEGQRRTESPTYNSTVLANIVAINNVKTTVFRLARGKPVRVARQQYRQRIDPGGSELQQQQTVSCATSSMTIVSPTNRR